MGGWETEKRSKRETKIEGTSRLPWVKAGSLEWMKTRCVWARDNYGHAAGLCFHNQVIGLWSFWKGCWPRVAQWLMGRIPFNMYHVFEEVPFWGSWSPWFLDPPPWVSTQICPSSFPQHLCSVPNGCRGSHTPLRIALQLSEHTDHSLCFSKEIFTLDLKVPFLFVF